MAINKNLKTYENYNIFYIFDYEEKFYYIFCFFFLDFSTYIPNIKYATISENNIFDQMMYHRLDWSSQR